MKGTIGSTSRPATRAKAMSKARLAKASSRSRRPGRGRPGLSPRRGSGRPLELVLLRLQARPDHVPPTSAPAGRASGVVPQHRGPDHPSPPRARCAPAPDPDAADEPRVGGVRRRGRPHASPCALHAARVGQSRPGDRRVRAAPRLHEPLDHLRHLRVARALEDLRVDAAHGAPPGAARTCATVRFHPWIGSLACCPQLGDLAVRTSGPARAQPLVGGVVDAVVAHEAVVAVELVGRHRPRSR